MSTYLVSTIISYSHSCDLEVQRDPLTGKTGRSAMTVSGLNVFSKQDKRLKYHTIILKNRSK